MALTIPSHLEQRLVALADSTWNDPQDLLEELLTAALRDDAVEWRLKAAIQAGDDSGPAEDSSLEGLMAEVDARRAGRATKKRDPPPK
ncbi:MAG TPA: hypothetical protein VFH68_13895 [Polyangia bacterium]|jgi:hypothetical protein|nr:hypothetical protein [Polyangia bacterium]